MQKLTEKSRLPFSTGKLKLHLPFDCLSLLTFLFYDAYFAKTSDEFIILVMQVKNMLLAKNKGIRDGAI
jgi:hypothetical protein